MIMPGEAILERLSNYVWPRIKLLTGPSLMKNVGWVRPYAHALKPGNLVENITRRQCTNVDCEYMLS